MGKNIGKNIYKNLSGKYSQKLFDHVKQSDLLKMRLKFFQKEQLKITGVTATGNMKGVEIMAQFKYLSNFLRTLEMPLIICESNFTLTWPKKCVISNNTKARIFAITDTKLYVPVVILSVHHNAKLLQQLISGFKRTIN